MNPLRHILLLIRGKKKSLSLAEHKANLQKLSPEQRSEHHKLAEKYENDAVQESADNSKRLDERIVWLAGGALAVLSNVTLAPSFENMQHREVLAISFIAFGLCLAFSIGSYAVFAEFFRSFEEIKILTQIPEKESITMNNAEKILNNMEFHRARGQHCLIVRNSLSRLCYLLCVIGTFSFIVFGIINFMW